MLRTGCNCPVLCLGRGAVCVGYVVNSYLPFLDVRVIGGNHRIHHISCFVMESLFRKHITICRQKNPTSNVYLKTKYRPRPAHSVFQVCLHISPKTFKPGVNVWVKGECTAIDGQPLWTPALPADSLSGSWGTEEGLTKHFSFTFFTLRSHRAAEELVIWATHLYM